MGASSSSASRRRGLAGLLLLAGCFPRADLSEYVEGNAQQEPNALQADAPSSAPAAEAGPASSPAVDASSAGNGEAFGTPDLQTSEPAAAERGAARSNAASGSDANAGAIDAAAPPAPSAALDAGAAEAGSADAAGDASVSCSGAGGTLQPGTRNCLLISAVRLSWQQAALACSAQGAALATLDSPELDVFLSTLMSAMTSDVWIGARDPGTDPASNAFVWIDGTPALSTNWAPGEPDAQGNQFCVAKTFAPPADPWRDRPCNELKAYVCERRF